MSLAIWWYLCFKWWFSHMWHTDLLCPQFKGWPIAGWGGSWALVDNVFFTNQQLECGHFYNVCNVDPYLEICHSDNCYVTKVLGVTPEFCDKSEERPCYGLAGSPTLWRNMFPDSFGSPESRQICILSKFAWQWAPIVTLVCIKSSFVVGYFLSCHSGALEFWNFAAI